MRCRTYLRRGHSARALSLASSELLVTLKTRDIVHGKSYDISRQQYNTEGLNNFEGNRWFKNIRRKKLLNTVNSSGQTRDRQALFGKLEARGSTRKYYSLMLEARLESSISHDVKPC